MTGVSPEILLDEWLAHWRPEGFRAGGDARADRFRGELGLPTDRPIVMTGHQPTLWHAGILTKYLAAQAIADRVGGAPAWCVPDQDVVEPGRVRLPVKRIGDATSGDPGRWDVQENDLLVSTVVSAGDTSEIPAAAGPACDAVEEPPVGFEDVVARLRTRRDETSVAGQIWRAHADVLRDRVGLAGAPTVFASVLGGTSLFSSIIESMRDDSSGCVRAYNDAVLGFPDAGMRELTRDKHNEKVELPLWRIAPGEPRRRIYAHELDDLEPATLFPRALLFTGMLRLAGCDLFLHGKGGGVYDLVTERWFAGWLGETLAPAGVASATLRLDLGVPEVDRGDLRDAVWRAHHARHSPEMLGDDKAQNDKDAFVQRIRSAPPADRGRLFAAMHSALGRARAARPDRIVLYDRDVGEIRAALADAEIARDRTWPWMLHSDESLAALRELIDDRLRAGSEGRLA